LPVYVVKYRHAGRQRFVTIGQHGRLTPDQARREAKRLLGLLASGVDPSARQRETFGDLARQYLAYKQATSKPKTIVERSRHLLTYAQPLHRIALANIDRRTIATCLSEIETASGRTTRNRLRSSLSGLFAWAISEGLAETNPVVGTGIAAEASRERVLSDAELASIWRALPESDYGDAVRLLILTGQRRQEIGGLRWAEVDLLQSLIVLPPERTKNGRQHQLPLSPAAKAILARRPRLQPFEFGRIGTGTGIGGWGAGKATLDQALAIPAWVLHDIRRTVATGLAKLGVMPHVIEAVLNHVSGHRAGVAGVYNRAKYESEMRQALDRWAAHLTAITNNNG
jgi:integrase